MRGGYCQAFWPAKKKIIFDLVTCNQIKGEKKAV